MSPHAWYHPCLLPPRHHHPHCSVHWAICAASRTTSNTPNQSYKYFLEKRHIICFASWNFNDITQLLTHVSKDLPVKRPVLPSLTWGDTNLRRALLNVSGRKLKQQLLLQLGRQWAAASSKLFGRHNCSHRQCASALQLCSSHSKYLVMSYSQVHTHPCESWHTPSLLTECVPGISKLPGTGHFKPSAWIRTGDKP